MSAEGLSKPAKQAKEDFAVISNRLAVAFAKRESLIKSWTASSSRPPPPAEKEEELEAEDAALFRNQPPYLGVGAPIPSHFLVSEAERNNKSLRAKFFPTKGLKASKARDAEEKATSAKRALKAESSDEEEGRSGLGRAKKLKMTRKSEPAKSMKEQSESEEDHRARSIKSKKHKTIKVEASRGINVPDINQGQTTAQSLVETTEFIVSKGDGKVEDEMETSKASASASSSNEPDDIDKKTQRARTTDPAELKRQKKREKRRRQKLRAALKNTKA
ncbi:uncharacterized protein LY89DRAFT_334364 [Mollisia scopiformis]|uniref:Uncharacterized protein n=1 Tax=Mollisia scopiformis TaxID=149040 RepID=A0A132B856_MOLSC|nr:uncharacterized protein LY89DRAFT_334364 [Mollisia scopiformis]KUJ08582.1 hypothetical protein LY89DRAFT_334364 [Mollisia scopiformis]